MWEIEITYIDNHIQINNTILLCAPMFSAHPQDTNFFFPTASQAYTFSDLYFVFERN